MSKNSKKIKAIVFMVALTLVVCLGFGAVITYALTLVNSNSSFTVQYTGKRDVYATINGASYIDETLDQSLTEVVINGQTSGTQTQNFGSNIALSQGETLKFVFTIENTNTYTTLSNLYVQPTITLTLPQNNNTELTQTTQFKIGSNEFANYVESINSCGYITVAKNQTLTIKVTVTLPATADDLTLTGSVALDLRSDRNLPTGYVDKGNTGLSLASILANGIGEYPQTRATAEVETALSAGIEAGTITANTKTWTVGLSLYNNSVDATSLNEYTYGGDRYVKVENVYNESTEENEDRFFKVEPIEVIQVNTTNQIAAYSGKTILATKKAITWSVYGGSYDAHEDTWNSWVDSSMRYFLNNNFMQESGLGEYAQTITIQNNLGWDETNNDYNMTDGSGTATQDKIWACSEDEVNAWKNETGFLFNSPDLAASDFVVDGIDRDDPSLAALRSSAGLPPSDPSACDYDLTTANRGNGGANTWENLSIRAFFALDI